MKQQIFGIRRLAYLRSEFSVEGWQITFGLWVFLVPVGRAQKSITTVVRLMEEKAVRLQTRIAI